MRNPQLNKHGELQHLLTLDGLPRSIITQILDTAAPFTEMAALVPPIRPTSTTRHPPLPPAVVRR